MSRERVRPQTDEANHGSRTLSVTEREESTPDESAASTSTAGVLRLRGRALNHVKVQWEEDVVDNEFLNRKKSKSTPLPSSPLGSRSTLRSRELTLRSNPASLLHLPQAESVRRILGRRVRLVLRLKRQPERRTATALASSPARERPWTRPRRS